MDYVIAAVILICMLVFDMTKIRDYRYPPYVPRRDLPAHGLRDGQYFILRENPRGGTPRLCEGWVTDEWFALNKKNVPYIRTDQSTKISFNENSVLEHLHGEFYSLEFKEDCYLDPDAFSDRQHPVNHLFKAPAYPNFPSLKFEYPSAKGLANGVGYYLDPSFKGKKKGAVVCGMVRNEVFTPGHMQKYTFENGKSVWGPKTYSDVDIHEFSLTIYDNEFLERVKHTQGPYYGFKMR